jgi:hypothetical protein
MSLMTELITSNVADFREEVGIVSVKILVISRVFLIFVF